MMRTKRMSWADSTIEDEIGERPKKRKRDFHWDSRWRRRKEEQVKKKKK